MSASTTTTPSERAAFERLFREEYATLVAASERIVRERPAAEDIVQEVFLRFFERGGLRVAEVPAAYLRRAVVTRTLNHLRDNGKLTHPGEESVWAAAEAAITVEEGPDDDLNRRLHDAIANLPPRAQTILRLHRFEGLPYREIARELGIAEKTVENQLARALRLLRRVMPHRLSVLMTIFFVGLWGVRHFTVSS